MFTNIFMALALMATISATPVQQAPQHYLGGYVFSLADRYGNDFVNTVFKDNILLTLAYMRGYTVNGSVNWADIEKPFTYSFTLKPGEVFAFHQDVLPQFAGKVVKTTNAHFSSAEGFKSDGYLVADGVCHLASLMNEAAQNAGLEVLAPTNHDFAVIPEIPRQFGTAIYFMEGQQGANALQNLYITNNKEKPVSIVFTYDGTKLKVDVNEAE